MRNKSPKENPVVPGPHDPPRGTEQMRPVFLFGTQRQPRRGTLRTMDRVIDSGLEANYLQQKKPKNIYIYIYIFNSRLKDKSSVRSRLHTTGSSSWFCSVAPETDDLKRPRRNSIRSACGLTDGNARWRLERSHTMTSPSIRVYRQGPSRRIPDESQSSISRSPNINTKCK